MRAALRIAPANHVTTHAATHIVSESGSIAGVGSSLLWVQNGFVNSSAEIICTTPDTVIRRSSLSFKRLAHSGGTTIASNGTLHNVSMDGTRDWLVRPQCMIFHSGLSLGGSPKGLKLPLSLVSGRGNFYINSYNAQITEIPAGASMYVERKSLLALEYDQNSSYEVVGNRPEEPATENIHDSLDVNEVNHVVVTDTNMDGQLQDTQKDAVRTADAALSAQTAGSDLVASPASAPAATPAPATPPTPHYYLYNNRWWIAMSKLTRGVFHSVTTIPSTLLSLFKKRTPLPASESTAKPFTPLASTWTWVKNLTNPAPFSSFVHVRGPTRVVVGQTTMPKITYEANDIEPYITDPELPDHVQFAPQAHDYLKIVQVINGQVVFRSVPNFDSYTGVNGSQ